LPVLVIALFSAGVALILPHMGDLIPTTVSARRHGRGSRMFWNQRQADLLGQNRDRAVRRFRRIDLLQGGGKA
jgi:hypothetical protein